MAQRIVVDNLVSEVRSQLNELNKQAVTDNTDIIPALNRAQNYATDIFARHYKDPLVTPVFVTMASGQTTHDIPHDAFEQRILKLESYNNHTFSELQYISYHDVGKYEVTTAQSNLPYYWTVIGDQFKILPAATGQNQLRVWYLKDPLPLVAAQGRINIVNATSNYIIVDATGPDLDTSSEELASFINLIDGETGHIKGTMQIQSIVGNKITLKTVPTRTTVLDLTVDTSLAALASTLTVNPDDYICLSAGNCVPFFKKPTTNFLIEYAVAEITRKLGGDAALEEQVLKRFEAQVVKSYVQRPNSLRVQKRNNRWTTYTIAKQIN